MKDSSKYKRENESYSSYRVHYHKSLKYNLSHQRFVVPWQMDEVKKDTEEVK